MDKATSEDLFRRGWKLLDAGRAKEGAKLFLEAALGGDSSCQNVLGNLFCEGRGVRRSERDGLVWFKRAVRQGEAHSAENIGLLYRDRGNRRRAIHWFGRAVAMGDGDALLERARLHLASPRGRAAAVRDLSRILSHRSVTEWSREQAIELLAKLRKGQRAERKR